MVNCLSVFLSFCFSVSLSFCLSVFLSLKNLLMEFFSLQLLSKFVGTKLIVRKSFFGKKLTSYEQLCFEISRSNKVKFIALPMLS